MLLMNTKKNYTDISISKTLSWLLRHGAVKEKLSISADGYINIREILQNKSLHGKCTIEDIKRVVASNDKKRFTLRNIDGELQIKANQGHSLEVVNSLDLRHINPSENVCVIHGTYIKFWKSIQINGLSRMNRNHIHFTSGLPSDNTVVSGMRSNCEIYIYINVKKAISEGIKFYQSPNGVILSPGNEKGIIETKYFSKVIHNHKNI